MELKVIGISKPEDVNLILGQSHFIKTVEDLHEALVGAVPGIRFGLAFCESSGPALVRWSGTDDELTELARTTMRELGTGHAFLILLRDAFPINVLPAVRAVQEVCGIYCASANPVQVVVAETEQGRGILGVIDGFHTQGIETEQDIAERKALLRRFGYKAG
jgi:adenosine/AMP kinase